jgi:hypothetical protein
MESVVDDDDVLRAIGGDGGSGAAAAVGGGGGGGDEDTLPNISLKDYTVEKGPLTMKVFLRRDRRFKYVRIYDFLYEAFMESDSEALERVTPHSPILIDLRLLVEEVFNARARARAHWTARARARESLCRRRARSGRRGRSGAERAESARISAPALVSCAGSRNARAPGVRSARALPALEEALGQRTRAPESRAPGAGRSPPNHGE